MKALLASVGVFGLLTLALTCAPRAVWPYPLEWMEGASLQHALLLAGGELPYAAPSADWIAYLYPPLAYVPVALASVLFGESLVAARMVSVACTLGTLGLLGVASARLANARAAGVLSAGIFALGFGYGGAFLDLVRVDACFVLCLAAAVERLSAGREKAALAWLVASALAKQHGGVLLLAVSAALVVRDRKRALPAAAASALVLVAALGALQLASDGWFARYAFEVPSQHGLEPALLVSFVLVDLLVYLPVLTVAGVSWIARGLRAFDPLAALTLAAIAVSALGRAHPGGDDNVRLPAFTLLCVVGVAPVVAKLLQGEPVNDELGTRSPKPRRIALTLALCLQAAMLFQPPSLHAPRAESAQRFDALRAALTRCAHGGRAVALDYAGLTGTPFVHTMALSDLRLGGDTPLGREATRVLLDALRGARAPAAIAVGERFDALQAVLDARYTLCTTLPAPRMATGYQPGWRGESGRLQRIYALPP